MKKRIGRWGRVAAGSMVAMAAAWLPGTAAAQSRFDTAEQTFEVPVREINVNAGVDIVYDSNVARTSDGGARRGLVAEDARIGPRIDADLTLPAGPTVVTIRGRAGYDFYKRNDVLNRERIGVDGAVKSNLGPCEVTAGLGYERSQNDLIDLAIDPADATNNVNVQDRPRVNGTLTCGRARIRPTAFADYVTVRNSDDGRKVSDVDVLTYGGGVAYTSTAFGVATAFVGRSEFDFPNREQFATAIQGFNVNLYGLRLDRRLGARLQIVAELAYADIQGRGDTGDTLDGLNWDISATLRLGDRLRLRLETTNNIDVASVFNVSAGRVAYYGAQLDYAFSPLIQGTLFASRRDREFEVDPALPQRLLLTEDEFLEVGARVAYRFNQRIDLTLGAYYNRRDADVALYDYDATRVLLGTRVRL